jgi:hypothetical protein
MVLGCRGIMGARKGCVALAATMFALAGCGGSAAHPPARSAAAPARGFHLPSSLLGLNQSTAASATQTRVRVISLMRAKPLFVDPSAAVYQNVSGGPRIAVYGGAFSSAGKSEVAGKLASFAKGFVEGAGVIGGRSFPPGPMGGVLECGDFNASGVAGVACVWADAVVAGAVVYTLGAASSPSEAASKTIQVRSAVEAGRSAISRPASPSASVSAATALTGAQLAQALAPLSSFAGYTENTKYTYNAGTGTKTLPTQYNLATLTCPSFAAQMIYATWFGQTALAWAQFDNPTIGGQASQTYDEFIYQFADDAAAGSFIQQIRSAYNRCQSYTDVESGASAQTTWIVVDLAPIAGGQAIEATGTDTGIVGTITADVFYVLSGNDVYGVVLGGALMAVPASPAAATVIEGMIKQVQDIAG